MEEIINKITDPLFVRWSEGAIHCYKRGCICDKTCDNYQLCYDIFLKKGKIPEMKISVINLVKRFGRPKGVKREIIKE